MSATPQEPGPTRADRHATISLVLGLVGSIIVVPLMGFFPLTLVMGVIGLVLGIRAWRGIRRGAGSRKGTAVAGTILSAVAVLFSVGALGAIVEDAEGASSTVPSGPVLRA